MSNETLHEKDGKKHQTTLKVSENFRIMEIK